MCAGHPQHPGSIAQAARLLGRNPFFVDENGYEREIIGAAISPNNGAIAYVETRAKDVGVNQYRERLLDVSIKVHIDDRTGNHLAADIESYNPFFGCDVRFFEWMGHSVLLIYQEKHWTFACRFGDVWPPQFVKIENRWMIANGVLFYVEPNATLVKRRTVPDLADLPAITLGDAEANGTLPPVLGYAALEAEIARHRSTLLHAQ